MNTTNHTTFEPTHSPTSSNNNTYPDGNSAEGDDIGYYIMGSMGGIILLSLAAAALYYGGCCKSFCRRHESESFPKILGEFQDVNVGLD